LLQVLALFFEHLCVRILQTDTISSFPPSLRHTALLFFRSFCLPTGGRRLLFRTVCSHPTCEKGWPKTPTQGTSPPPLVFSFFLFLDGQSVSHPTGHLFRFVLTTPRTSRSRPRITFFPLGPFRLTTLAASHFSPQPPARKFVCSRANRLLRFFLPTFTFSRGVWQGSHSQEYSIAWFESFFLPPSPFP